MEGASVIICCYNSEKTIPLVLKHLESQVDCESFPWEVIVVDNASTDRTAEVARENWTRNEVDFQVVPERQPGLSHARRKGLETARFGFIVFVDDDNLMDATYVSRAHAILTNHPDVGLAGGLGIPQTDGDFPDWFEGVKTAYAVGPQAEEEGYLPKSRTYLHGAGVIMRKSVWDRLMASGFTFLLSGRTGKSLSSGEDSEITSAFRMAGYRLWYDPKLTFVHLIAARRLNWDYVRKLGRSFGQTMAVLDLYRSELLTYRGWKRLKTRNWLIGLLVCFKVLLFRYPAYVRLRRDPTRHSYDEFQYRYFLGAFRQRLFLVFRFPALKRRIARLAKALRQFPPPPKPAG